MRKSQEEYETMSEVDATLQEAQEHFLAAEDCVWCCTHLDAVSLDVAMSSAIRDGYTWCEDRKPDNGRWKEAIEAEIAKLKEEQR